MPGEPQGSEMNPHARAKDEPKAAQRRPKGAKRGRTGCPGVPGARSKETRKEKNREEDGHGSKIANMQKSKDNIRKM